MLICFKSDEVTKNNLDDLVKDGAYRDYSDVINVAVRNLTLLHSEMGSARAFVVGQAAANETPKLKTRDESNTDQTREPSSDRLRSIPAIPELFQRLPADGTAHLGEEMPDDAFLSHHQVPVDRWPFGQYSKLLPAKASVRALANLVEKQPRATLESLASRIATEAANLAGYLRALDDRLDLQRDDALAVGFPSADTENAEKSRLRYANQFVGAVNRAGKLSGLLVDLKLINLVDGRTPRINLTAPGWAFALLENPVLDSDAPDGQKFNTMERTFLTDHIYRHVPAEAFAYRTILRAIAGGAATPDALDEVVQSHVPYEKRDRITRAFLTTQRSGAISRMADLNLVARQRSGIRVTYRLTTDGEAFVSREAAA